MTFVVILLVALLAVAVAVAVWVAAARRPSGPPGQEGRPSPGPSARVRPEVAAFHVRGDAAHVEFAVPLPPGDPGEHLRRLLCHEAAAVLREKREHGLPVAGVTVVVAYGQRDGSAIEVGRVEPEAGIVPEVAIPGLLPHSTAAGFDPLAHLGEQEFDIVPGLAVSAEEGGLPPIAQSIELTGPTADALRAQGIDPASASLSELTLGLLKAAGYQLVPSEAKLSAARSGSVYRAARGDRTTMIAVLESEPGGYPELPERAINEMIVLAGQQNLPAFLVTDTYAPYVMYEKERRSTVRFITRERMQAFVDSFALRG